MIALAAGAAVLGIATAAGHSIISERLFLQPLFAEPRAGLFVKRGMRDIIRVIFHLPSMAWAVVGIAVLVAKFAGNSPVLSVTAALIFAGSGLANLIALRRPHPGGIMLLAAAALVLTDWRLDG